MKRRLENGTGSTAPLLAPKFTGSRGGTGRAVYVLRNRGSGLTARGARADECPLGALTQLTPFVLPKATRCNTLKVQFRTRDRRSQASTGVPPVAERETVGGLSQGVPLQKAQALVGYWRTSILAPLLGSHHASQLPDQITGCVISFLHMPPLIKNALPTFSPTDGRDRSLISWMSSCPLTSPPPLRWTAGGRLSSRRCRRSQALPSPTSRLENGPGAEQDRPRLGEALDATPLASELGAQVGLGRA